MRMVLAAALAASLLACAAQPPAQTAMAESAPAAKTAGAEEGQRLICRDEDAPTGSHLRRTQRICATEEEWQRRREMNQRAVEDLRQRAGQANPGGN